MHQVAEIFAAERVIAEVLDDRSTIGICMRFFDLVFGKVWIALQQKGSDWS